jgi:NodT family efflux transporter outer membrane factor (OMF) lipoprotein
MSAGRIAALAVALLAAGCATQPELAPATPKRTAAQLGAQPAAAAKVDWPRDDWWRDFDDPQLDTLIERALKGNPQLDLAAARLARAQAAAALADARSQPSLDLEGHITYQHYSENFIYPPPLGGSEKTNNLLQLTGIWELDFFGRNRAALRAALSQQQAAAVEQQAARILLAAHVARRYMQLAYLLETRDVLAATLTQREQIVGLVQARVAGGLDTKVELRQAEGAVPDVRRQIEAADEQVRLTRHALAALLGEGPEVTVDLAPRLQQARTPALPVAIPADLIGRRADIAAARWRIEAMTAEVDRARTLFYPSVNLTAFVGFQSFTLSRWFDLGSQNWGAGPAVSLPVFDAGRLAANLQAQSAELDSAVATYNTTLIDAVRDVADQIASLRSIDRQEAEQRSTLQAAESAYDLATQRYRAGLGNYLTVLAAQTNVLAQRRTTSDLKARRADTTIQLMQALGGGFFADPKPGGGFAADPEPNAVKDAVAARTP